jgi:hypothetical protein|tara:strand:- start:468 stop:701 length:234 start_codon:yes stop_codon:yes gene_type:complete
MAKKYVILNSNELSSVNFNRLATTSSDTVRYNLNRDKFLVSFIGNTPSELVGKTQYTEEEIFTIIDDISNGWYENEE